MGAAAPATSWLDREQRGEPARMFLEEFDAE
jgi:hypothetical protein